jgi:two-component system, OmpR family, response regulator
MLMVMITERATLLIVDDEASIRSALTTMLLRAGFEVYSAASGQEALHLMQTVQPALVLLDVVLDETNSQQMSGLDVLRVIRGWDHFVPVIMLTSYAEWQLESLGLGVIAFVVKPWDINILLGQIRSTLSAVAQIRRDAVKRTEPHSPLKIYDIEIDLERYRVNRAGQAIDLTPTEFALLAFLISNPNREWTREQLLNQVWGYEWVGYERTVDRHVAALRRKLRLERDELIETLHGMGYRLVP